MGVYLKVRSGTAAERRPVFQHRTTAPEPGMTGSISDSVSAEQERDGTRLPSHAYRLGVDEAGREHWHSAIAHTVWVFREDELVREEDLGQRRVVEWVLFVDEELEGWVEHEPVGQTDGFRGLVEDVRAQTDAVDRGEGPVTDGGRPRQSERTCARCDDDAEPGSRFCGDHGRVMTDGGFAHKLQYAGAEPYEPEDERLPHRVMELLEQDETYQRLAMVRWLADELEADLAGTNSAPAETRQALFDAVASGEEAPLQKMVDAYVERWLRVHRTDFEPDVIEPALATYTDAAEVSADAN